MENKEYISVKIDNETLVIGRLLKIKNGYLIVEGIIYDKNLLYFADPNEEPKRTYYIKPKETIAAWSITKKEMKEKYEIEKLWGE